MIKFIISYIFREDNQHVVEIAKFELHIDNRHLWDTIPSTILDIFNINMIDLP